MRNLFERLFAKWLADPNSDLIILEHAADVLVVRGYDHIARRLLDIVSLEKSGNRMMARRASAAEMRKAPPAGVAP